MKHNKKAGFTLIEILLSLALIALMAGMLVPAYHMLQTRNDLDIAAVLTAQTLRRAQTLSRAMDGDSSWGVYVEEESVTLFKGASYDDRDSDFDEVSNISSALSLSGTQEFVYAKLSGIPQNTGTLTLTLNENETRNITINVKGTITY
ncbi:MAG TPA: prepilin-type N-terminal cleavage/methylation domain-containing protein [Candidatus Paceibacterota bacterium]|nr:prepilin-type N-terminal cleavage/methylation domain-containing protein [Candidatus Paceibacterota bacterium]